MIRWISGAQAVKLHATLCDQPLLDMGKLDGALRAPQQTVGGDDAYPTLVAKAAKLVEAIATAHSFLDGNKRLGWLVATSFLELNGASLAYIRAEEVDRTVRDLVEHRLSRPQFEVWLSDTVVASWQPESAPPSSR